MSNYWRVRKEKGGLVLLSIFILRTAASQLSAHEATKCEDLVPEASGQWEFQDPKMEVR